MRSELEILRDIATSARFIVARRPFEGKDDEDAVFRRYRSQALLQAELVWLKDHELAQQGRSVCLCPPIGHRGDKGPAGED